MGGIDVSPEGDIERMLDLESSIEEEDEKERYDKSEKFFEKLFTMLFSDEDLDKRTYLTTKNEKGILKGLSKVHYVRKTMGFELDGITNLIAEKRRNTLSLKGRNIQNMLQLVRDAMGRMVIKDTEPSSSLEQIIKP